MGSSPALTDSIQYIKGVGPKRALLFKKLGLENVIDCLDFIPFRYEDRTFVQKIGQIRPDIPVTFFAEVEQCHIFRLNRRRRLFEVVFKDETGTISGRWYQFNEKYHSEKFAPKKCFIVSGKPTLSKYSDCELEIIHPDTDEVLNPESNSIEMGSILPIYRSTEKLSLKVFRLIMKTIIEKYSNLIQEWLPSDILKRNQLLKRTQAVREVHFPPKQTSIVALNKFRSPGQYRLIFEELFLFQIGLAFKRKYSLEKHKGLALKTRGNTLKQFIQLLEFDLTGAQKRVLGQIMDDLEKSRPMNRLVHGDVGSGKTVIALITLLTAADNGYQGALMAPTEILSEQHFLNITPYCDALGIRLELITSALSHKEKKQILKNIKNGQTQIIVGTHSLIQKDVEFKNLSVAVIDEQHRFGVLQREAFSKKGIHPHILIMTATPIPRSLALTLYGDMDVSLLDEMPPGRQTIKTKIFFDSNREKAYKILKDQVDRGFQGFVVCPLIEESETIELKNAIEVLGFLKEKFPTISVELIHGKLKKEERQKIMTSFKNQEIQILVATTVIEVGIDIPNATVILIEHAERFGLAQLHQLRGRVGRGSHPSQCLLVAYRPTTEDATLRLKAMENSHDGFKIAEKDLEIRGPGDFMGTRQSGLPMLRWADLIRDFEIIKITRKEAFHLIDRDPRLEDSKHQALKKVFFETLGDRIDFMDIL